MAATVGQLIVNLRASTAAFAKDLGKAKQLAFSNSKEISRSLCTIGKAAAVAGAAVAAGAAVMIKNAAESADHFAKFSRASGVSVEALSALSHAAQLSGMDMETMEKGVSKLASSITQAARGSETYERAFHDLKIQLRDVTGQLRPTEDVLVDLAEAFAAMPDGTTKAGLASEIFGERIARKMVPFLNQGKAGIKGMMEEAKRLGLVISTDTAKQSEQFNDNLLRLKRVTTGFANAMLTELVPSLASFSGKLVEAAGHTESFRGTVHGLATMFRFLAQVSIASFDILNQIGTMLGGLAAAAEQLWHRNLSGARVAIQEMEKALIENSKFSEDLMRTFDEGAGQIESKAPRLSSKIAAPVIQGKQKVKKEVDEIKQILSGLVEQAATFGMAGEEAQVYKLRMAGATDSQIEFAEAVIQSIQDLRDFKRLQEDTEQAMAEYDRRLDDLAASVKEYVRDDADRLIEFFDQLNELLKAGKIDLETWEKAIQKAQDAVDLERLKRETEGFDDGIKDVTRSCQDMAHAVGTAFEDAILSGRGLRDVLAGLLQDIGRIILRLAVTKPLERILTSALGGIFGGGAHFQHGGRPPVGQASIVGERGPELFVPDTAGRIIPHEELGGDRAIQINYNIDARGADLRVESRILWALKMMENRAVARAKYEIREAALRGG